MAAPVSQPPVEVAGLQIPADLAPQIIAAFRALYPTVTEGKDDDAAVRATLVWFIISTLETHAGRQATDALEATVAQMRSKAAAQASLVSQQIHAAASRIKEKAATPPTAEGPTP